MSNQKFIAGPPLGRLCRWLRAFGFDCVYFPCEEGTPEEPDRIYLTRHVDLVQRGVIFIGEDKVSDQLFVLNLLVPLKGGRDPLSRCMECNVPLQDIPRQEIAGEVPEHVYTTHEEFTRCPSCGRVYWPGTHVDRMEERMREILG